MIPIGSGKRNLDVFHFFGLDQPSKVFEILDITATNMLDFTVANNRLAGLDFFFYESSNVGHVETEHVRGRILDLGETLEVGEEGTPEHFAS